MRFIFTLAAMVASTGCGYWADTKNIYGVIAVGAAAITFALLAIAWKEPRP